MIVWAVFIISRGRRFGLTERDVLNVGVLSVGWVGEKRDTRSAIIVKSIWRKWWVAGCSCRWSGSR